MASLLFVLVATVVVLGVVAGPVLDRVPVAGTRPGAIVVCWAGALIGTFAAVAGMTAIALVLPPTPGHGLLEWVRDCLPHHGPAAVAAASLASAAIAGVWCVSLARGLPRVHRTLRHRRAHLETLHLVARADERNPDVLVLDHPLPVAYCLPSRWRPIVLSTGAQHRLTTEQLEAVLEHERAHLRHRHHLLLLLVDLAYALAPWLPTVRRARASVPPLLEMTADDAAASRWGNPALAGALRQVTAPAALAGALAAGGGDTLAHRLARLEAEAPGPRRGGRPLAWAFAASAAFLPCVAVVRAFSQLPGLC